MTVITYFLMVLLPRGSQHKFVFAFNLGYLSCSHIYRMYTNFGGWDMDITTYTMVLTAKLSSLGFCYKDGMLKDSELTKDQIERKLVDAPSIFELFSYTFFCCGCLIGPFFEFADFINFMEMKGHYKQIPSTIIPSIIRNI